MAAVGGSRRDYRAIAGTLAKLSGAAVRMVDYCLATEHGFPAGLDDCIAAFGWASRHRPDEHRQRGHDAQVHFSLVGDSAGRSALRGTCGNLYCFVALALTFSSRAI
ncbi:alpha/beta hydrolase [Bradyrhizobium macuxiense]|uniref:alpha/beta hydrolase n=1 Tax=Bradyrhizobium macuxiense TaxID=1755647 RepID=UPI001FEE06B0|nr:alpha/beta hydrolase fold domain-containing protein [Bradyrhizobium macuxiense]